QKHSDAFVKKVNSLDFSAHLDKDLPLELADDIYHKAAAIKEIIKRKTGMTLFDSQLRTAYGLYNKKIVELATGEGKTLSAVMASILFCLDGRKVSVLVFNDYLAKRDGTKHNEIFDACGVKCGYITAQSTTDERKAAYNSDVLYIAAKEQGFDYLRNTVIYDKNDFLDINFDVCIVDEADSILIDESGVPLVLAGGADDKEDFAVLAHNAVLKLEKDDYTVDLGEKQVWLNDSGVKKIEAAFELDNLYDDRNFIVLSAINTSLEANFLFEKDKDYIIKDGEIKIIDESTGRVAAGRRFPDSLQHAVEVKEGLKSGDSTKIYNTITVQSFLNGYKTLSGMTGTAMTSAKEIWSMYETDTVAVESHVPCMRVDM
ncbi:MAG: preprotein translocase subunit SecA, partial [Oscillospiraceae bacterium]|nr:preprotein translocase subunit SecA [Candidatus Equicaccousia limihippi]